MLKAAEFTTTVKSFLRIPDNVSIYDQEIEMLTESALESLQIAGVNMVKTPTLSDYVATFVRLRMLHDASAAFTSSEEERLNVLIRLMTYGTAQEVKK